jgi:predicted amidohydrolase
MSVLRLAVAAVRIERSSGIAGWRQRLDALAAEARAGGAEMLLLPEYWPLEAAAGDAPDLASERARALEMADELIAEAEAVAVQHGLILIPGSLLVRDEPPAVVFSDAPGGAIRWPGEPSVHNLAPFVRPDIRPDGWSTLIGKGCVTRFEAESLAIQRHHTGPDWRPTPWGNVGVAICYDAEFPPFTRALAAPTGFRGGCFLILVPACTDTPAGWTRVEISARAAAIQNQCFVAVAPTVGEAPWSAMLDTNFGRAAIFGPADHGFPDDGILAAGPMDEAAMVFADLDTAALERVREHGAVRNFADWPYNDWVGSV